jgi:DNA-directed RNA polymerase subunit K/omega
MVEYLEFIEEYNEITELSRFDKVKVIASRTRDLYEGKTSKATSEHDLEKRKPSTVAHYEVIKGYIEPDIHEKEEKPEDFIDDIEIDE